MTENSIVKDWFGRQFAQLHPKLQHLHLYGGMLTGEIQLNTGKGLAGVIGRRLAKKLGIPQCEHCKLKVNIFHSVEGLHWHRQFGNDCQMQSLFIPVGYKGNGFWIEKTGPLKMFLDIDIIDYGWHWRCLKFQFYRLPLPVWLFPKSVAYKTIVNDEYRFVVRFSMPLIGELLCYQGNLQLVEQ